MARSRFLSMAGCGALALLAGCAGTATVAPDVDATGMPNAELALQRSVERVDAAVRDLGGMGVSARAAAPAAPAVIPAELRRPVTWSWSGPLDAGAKALADRIGYRLVITASPGAAPVNVAVSMQDARISAASCGASPRGPDRPALGLKPGRAACSASSEGGRSPPMTMGWVLEPVMGVLSGLPSACAAWFTWPSEGAGGTGVSTGSPVPAAAGGAPPTRPARTVAAPSRTRSVER